MAKQRAAKPEASTTDQWLKARRSGIGGSDIAAIVGLSPWKTAFHVYLDKTQPHAPEKKETEQQELGKAYESAILDVYEKRVGCELERRSNAISRHPWVDYFMGSYDAVAKWPLVPDGKEIAHNALVGPWVVDAKNVDGSKSDEWGKDGSDVCPEDLAIQMLWYCGIGAFPKGDLAAAIGNRTVRIITIKSDQEIIDWLQQRAHAFWNDHVLKGVPPTLDTYHRSAFALVKKIHGGLVPEAVKLHPTQHLERLLREYFTGQALESVGKKMATAAKTALLEINGNAAAAEIVGTEWGFTAKKVKKAAYSVEATEYLDFRVKAPKNMKPVLAEAEELILRLAQAGIDRRALASASEEETE